MCWQLGIGRRWRRREKYNIVIGHAHSRCASLDWHAATVACPSDVELPFGADHRLAPEYQDIGTCLKQPFLASPPIDGIDWVSHEENGRFLAVVVRGSGMLASKLLNCNL